MARPPIAAQRPGSEDTATCAFQRRFKALRVRVLPIKKPALKSQLLSRDFVVV
ncbi:hypothetical protein SynSYN20_02053 [Synechococcus sp. SYN20]|nr:hypothetical protein SynSYN20_02053 [Synechococcus sp. SYN20]